MLVEQAKERLEEISRRMAESQARINKYRAIIARLETQKEVIASQKKSCKEVIKQTEKIVESDYIWKGENYERMKLYKGVSLVRETESYRDVLDTVLDSLNSEISSYKKLIYQEETILSGLRSLIEDIKNSVENFFN